MTDAARTFHNMLQVVVTDNERAIIQQCYEAMTTYDTLQHDQHVREYRAVRSWDTHRTYRDAIKTREWHK